MRRLLLVSHRPVAGSGGAVARWRSFVPHLEALGWEVDVVAAAVPAGGGEFASAASARRRFARRARLMRLLRTPVAPALAAVGLRPAALTPSTLWAFRGARTVRRRVRSGRYDVVLATAPPVAAALAARLARSAPLVVEFRDLWAGNPAYGQAGGVLGVVEAWLLRGAAAVVAVTPEAAADLRERHPSLASRVVEIPNGFEPSLLERREERAPSRPLTILHSGTLTPERPLASLLAALARRPRGEFRLVLHGYLAPEAAAEVAAAPDAVDVDVVPPSSWDDAVRRMAAADVCLVTQSRAAGDATAVAGKVYEYLALGRPVLCLSHGGATHALLRRLDADGLSVDLDDAAAIDAALDRVPAGDVPAVVPASRLLPYSRDRQARQLSDLLERVAADSS